MESYQTQIEMRLYESPLSLVTFYLVAHKTTPCNELMLGNENHDLFKSPHLMDKENEAQRELMVNKQY